MPRKAASPTVPTLAIALTLGLSLALLGCSSTPAPTLTVTSAAVKTTGQDACVLEFTLRGVNTSDEPLPLREVAYTLRLDGATVFSGRRAAMATLPAGGEQTFTLPAPVRYEQLGVNKNGAKASGSTSAGHRWSLTGTTEYLTEGQLSSLLFDTGVRRPTASFQTEGVLPAIERGE